MLVAPLLILVAIMILEMPLVSTETPISVPMAQTDAEGLREHQYTQKQADYGVKQEPAWVLRLCF